MKKFLVCFATLLVITACNDSSNENDVELKDPTETQPVSDAIPDSMELVNDSVIVPDNGRRPVKADSVNRH